jgi:signal transduction histidine kinase
VAVTDKRTDSPRSLRVFTQRADSGRTAASRLHARSGVVGGRIGEAIVPICALAFVVSAVVALLALTPQWPEAGSVVLDSNNQVTSVRPGSLAWIEGVRPGWFQVAVTDTTTSYGDGGQSRPVDDRPPPGVLQVGQLEPALLTLAVAAGLYAVRQKRLASTAAIAAAGLAAPVWALRIGAAGEVIACLPALVAGGFAWQVADGIGALPGRLVRVATGLAMVAAAVVTATVFQSAGLRPVIDPILAGVVAAAGLCVALAWLLVVGWHAGTVKARPGPRTTFGTVRAVALDMLPYSEPARHGGAVAERERLASDLHAELLPALASTVVALEKRGAADEAARLRSLTSSVRDLVSARRLPILQDEGLVPAAEWLAESLEERSQLVIEVDLAGNSDSRWPRPVERAAYRVIQLALDNVIRHAGATTARVAIAGDANSLNLSVADDGLGVAGDPATPVAGRDGGAVAARGTARSHLGLADMRAEAESIGAILTVSAGSHRGTIVAMRWRG